MRRLRVYTARLNYSGADRVNITRAFANSRGELGVFAPSQDLVTPFIQARQRGEETADSWQEYRAAYIAEMRRSYVQFRMEWEELLARDEVTLVCYCENPERCHRSVLGHILSKLGANYCGERTPKHTHAFPGLERYVIGGRTDEAD